MTSPKLILASQTSANPDITIDLPENGAWFVIGSSPDCNSCILDLSVGKKHCQLRFFNNSIQIQTLDFGIGTWINNAPIDDIVTLKENDTVGIGDLLFKAKVPPVSSSAESPLQNEPKSNNEAPSAPPASSLQPPASPLQNEPKSNNEAPSAPPASSLQPPASPLQNEPKSNNEAPSAPPASSLQPPASPLQNEPTSTSPPKPLKPPSYLRSPYSRPGSKSRTAPPPQPPPHPAPSAAPPQPVSSLDQSLIDQIASLHPQYASKHTPQSLSTLIQNAQSNAQKLGFLVPDEILQFCQCALLCNDELSESNSVNSDVWLTLTLQGKPAPMRLKRALSIAQRIAESRYSSPISSTPKPPPAPKPAPVENKPTSTSTSPSPAPAPAAPAPPAPPSSEFPIVEGFAFKRKITSGPMGDVYEAHDITLDVPVALKFLHGMSPPAMERFLSEARAAAKVQHPNLVPVRSFGQTPLGCYYVMPFITGLDGDQLVEAFKTASAPTRAPADILIAAGIKPDSVSSELQQAMSCPQPYYALIARWIAMAAEGLERAHAAGVIHRDIKPGNLMLTNEGRMMITDFGLALRFDERFTAGCVGTPRYLSPEMLAAWAAGSAGADLDERMDIWGLGLCLIELLTLRPPYEGTIDKIFRDIATLDAPRPKEFIPAIPDALDEICAKACQRNPAKRYAHAIELAVDLRNFTAAPAPNGQPDEKSSGIFGWLRNKR